MQSSEQQVYDERITQLNREAAGLLRCEVIQPADVGPMTLAALGGNPDAMARLVAVIDGAKQIKAMARKKPAICLCCPRRVRDPHATLAILIAASDYPTVALASPVCERCSVGEIQPLLSRIAAAFTTSFPQLRPIEITHPEGGRA